MYIIYTLKPVKDKHTKYTIQVIVYGKKSQYSYNIVMMSQI